MCCNPFRNTLIIKLSEIISSIATIWFFNILFSSWNLLLILTPTLSTSTTYSTKLLLLISRFIHCLEHFIASFSTTNSRRSFFTNIMMIQWAQYFVNFSYCAAIETPLMVVGYNAIAMIDLTSFKWFSLFYKVPFDVVHVFSLLVLWYGVLNT